MGMNDFSRLSDNIKIDHVYDADGAYNGTGAGMLAMRDYEGCLVLAVGASVTPVTTHHITGFKVVGNTTAAGAGTDHTIISAVTTDGGTVTALTQADMGTAAPTAITDQTIMALDFRSSDMTEGDKFISVISTSTGTFPVTFIYIRYKAAASLIDMIQATRTAFEKLA